MGIGRRLLRIAFTALHRLRRRLWAAAGPGREGVHALALTERGAVVLVRLTYAPGWRLPGGGRKAGEAPAEAILRELREEIGLVAHHRIERLEAIDFVPELPGDRSALFRVTGVRYRPPKWNLEVEEVREFDPRRLPDDATGWTRAMVDAYAAGPDI